MFGVVHPEPDVPHRSEARLVLVVEDEALVQMVAVDLLEEHGFRVRTAFNASEAMKLLQANDGFHAVFTDIDLGGGLDGFELARLAREVSPRLVVVYASGRPQDTTRMVPGAVFISKPYSMGDLACALGEPYPPRDKSWATPMAPTASSPNSSSH